ncbi:hypothetical protein C8R43DRAFT_1118302 [Mycena crocata]|nr:hypothetical protein C8R43DRAFT_1118302 [Mycena crocata]
MRSCFAPVYALQHPLSSIATTHTPTCILGERRHPSTRSSAQHQNTADLVLDVHHASDASRVPQVLSVLAQLARRTSSLGIWAHLLTSAKAHLPSLSVHIRVSRVPLVKVPELDFGLRDKGRMNAYRIMDSERSIGRRAARAYTSAYSFFGRAARATPDPALSIWTIPRTRTPPAQSARRSASSFLRIAPARSDLQRIPYPVTEAGIQLPRQALRTLPL